MHPEPLFHCEMLIADEPGEEDPGRDVQVDAPAEVGQEPPVHVVGLKAVWAKQMLLKMQHNESKEKNILFIGL